jgi:hypothetical protein
VDSPLRYLATPDQGFTPGTLEWEIEEALKAAARATRGQLTFLSAEQMARIPYAPGNRPSAIAAGTPRSLADLRDAINAGWGCCHFYRTFGEWLVGLVGGENLKEASAVFGLASGYAPPPIVLRNTIQVMRVARELSQARDCTLWRFQDELRGSDLTRRQVALIHEGYETGKVISRLSSRLARWYFSVIDAYENNDAPFVPGDSWIGKLLGFKNPEYSTTNAGAVIYSQAIINWLAREMGVPSHRVQAAGWFAIRQVYLNPTMALVAAALDREQITLGQAVHEGLRQNVFASPDPSPMLEALSRHPLVQEELRRFRSILDIVSGPPTKHSGSMWLGFEP